MKDEIRGKVTELIDEESGIILGEDNNNYIFSKMDFLGENEISVNEDVIFKPKVFVLKNELGNTEVRKAILIDKE